MNQLTVEERKTKIHALLQDDSFRDLLQNYISLSKERQELTSILTGKIINSNNSTEVLFAETQISNLIYSQLYKLRNLILRKCGVKIDLFEEIWEDTEGNVMFEIYMNKMIEEDNYPVGTINKCYIKLLVTSLVNLDLFHV